MTMVAIPDWTSQGTLPPIHAANPTSVERSPYKVTSTDLVLHFGTTAHRQTILSGLLSFRAALHAAGITAGFQWVDGSFLEDIETTESREPRDVDVVTFFHLPSDESQQNLIAAHPRLFDPAFTKADHQVDAYFVQLNREDPEPLVQLSTYWYSLWSHRRDGYWKGYLQVELSLHNDAVAKANLDRLDAKGGQL